MIENGNIKTYIIEATAQAMGTEQYDCEDDMGPYQSSFPCETEVCVTPCQICGESMPCELYEGHAYVQHSDESQKEVTKEEDLFPLEKKAEEVAEQEGTTLLETQEGIRATILARQQHLRIRQQLRK